MAANATQNRQASTRREWSVCNPDYTSTRLKREGRRAKEVEREGERDGAMMMVVVMVMVMVMGG